MSELNDQDPFEDQDATSSASAYFPDGRTTYTPISSHWAEISSFEKIIRGDWLLDLVSIIPGGFLAALVTEYQSIIKLAEDDKGREFTQYFSYLLEKTAIYTVLFILIKFGYRKLQLYLLRRGGKPIDITNERTTSG